MCVSCIVETNRWLMSVGKEDECVRDDDGNIVLDVNWQPPLVANEKDKEIEELKAALAWAWKNLSKTNHYPDDESEYDFCVVCQHPEWKHRENCGLAEQKAKAQALINGERI